MLIDTNILIRYLLQDHDELSKKATDIIINNDAICLHAVIYEVIHVLQSIYKMDRVAIADLLTALFVNQVIGSENKAVIIRTLVIFKQTSMDFIDCLLIARHILYQDTIHSFDKKLNNYILRHNSH